MGPKKNSGEHLVFKKYSKNKKLKIKCKKKLKNPIINRKCSIEQKSLFKKHSVEKTFCGVKIRFVFFW